MHGSSRAMNVLCLLVLAVGVSASSPVQKVIGLLDECKAKVQRDLDVEAKAMEKYAAFCDDEVKAKTYAIDKANREIEELEAQIESGHATANNHGEEISRLGNLAATKERELAKAHSVRDDQHEVFGEDEKEMAKSVDELSRGVQALKQGQSFLQGPAENRRKLQQVLSAISSIVESGSLDAQTQDKLQSFLQAAQKANSTHSESDDSEEDDEENALLQTLKRQPAQGTVKAFESQGGGIIQTMEDMEEKAEDTLSELRKREVEQQHAFDLVKNALESEISHTKDKLTAATQGKAQAEQGLENANGRLVETRQTRTSDDEYMATMKMDCQTKAREWEERERSARGEIAAIEKAREILSKGVTAMMQVSMKKMQRGDADSIGGALATAADGQLRAKLNAVFTKLLEDGASASFSLTQLSQAAATDPFAKVRGLLQNMISKLMTEASEEATHEAFCQQEMAKSKESQENKQAKVDTYKMRMDKAATTIARLLESVNVLEGEIAEIDQATAEATALRNQEHEEYTKASTEFRDSAAAVAKAMEVLKNYYETTAANALVQMQASSAQPKFGEAKSDSAHGIVAILEIAEEDFTALLAETEETEGQALAKYKQLSQENRVSRAAKATDIKAKQSEVKSLKVALSHHTDDHSEVSRELDAVTAYLNKLKPECETKVMSYAERKAARETEIEGLRDALNILAGSGV